MSTQRFLNQSSELDPIQEQLKVKVDPHLMSQDHHNLAGSYI